MSLVLTRPAARDGLDFHHARHTCQKVQRLQLNEVTTDTNYNSSILSAWAWLHSKLGRTPAHQDQDKSAKPMPRISSPAWMILPQSQSLAAAATILRRTNRKRPKPTQCVTIYASTAICVSLHPTYCFADHFAAKVSEIASMNASVLRY